MSYLRLLGYAGGSDLYAYCNNNPVMGADPSGYIDLSDPSSAYDYWMTVAVDGETAGGVGGNAQAAGACFMTACIDYFGARNVQRDAAATGDRAGNGETGGAVGYGMLTAVEIGLSATAGWTGGGGAAAKGVGLAEVGWYELGSQTIKGTIYDDLEAKGLTTDKVALGRQLWKDYGWDALSHLGLLRPGRADWGFTFRQGPSPGGYVLGTLVTRGGQQLLENHCIEDLVK